MKRIFIAFLIVTSLNVNGQYIRATSDTTYLTTDRKIGTLTKSSGEKYDLYLSIRGKIYYWKVSQKTGLPYRVYPKHIYKPKN